MSSTSLSGSLAIEQHHHAFFSHNGADKSLVRILADALEKRGISCWLDNWNLIPGDPWQPAIEEALSRCDTCVVFFGPHGLGPWQNEEMRLALQRRINSRERKLRVLPVILPGGQRAKESDLPGFLQGTTWVQFRESIDDEDVLHLLECGIRGVPPGRGSRGSILAGECPYLGLKTFQPEDAPLFFGRAAKIQELVDRLRNNFGTPKEERFLALIGASGSGKSSLALAGLIPAIRHGELPESGKWPLIRCRPGARPWENLQIALSTSEQVAWHVAALPTLIKRLEDEQRRLHLTAQLALHDRPESHRLFVLIDQFEEIFTLCNDEGERKQLIDNLLYATNVAGSRTIAVLTMRADFYGRCANYRGLRAAIADHQSLIGPLSEEELHEAIETPAQLAGGELGPGLMELLLADMKGQAGALPFLEHALFELWEKRDGRRLTAKTYTETGRLQGALDAHAEEFFTKNLTTEEQLLCRQVLVDLVHPGEGTADTKKRVSLEDVAPTSAGRAVLKKLADARLVTTDRDERPEAAQAELAHEALISGWHRLGDWVNENREQSRHKERLLDSAREWQRNSKRQDFLYRGAQLATAEESFGSSSEKALPKLAAEFLDASVAERRREQEERQRQLWRRQRLFGAAVATFALLAAVAGAAAVFGFWQKGEAERQKTAAEKEARLAIAAERSAKEQTAAARKAEDSAREAQKKTSEVASQAHISLARYSNEAGNNAEGLAHLAQALRLSQRNYEAVALTCALLTQTRFPLPVTDSMRHSGWVVSAQFSPDARRVVTASQDGTARLWDAANGQAIGEPMKHRGAVNSAQFSPDGQRVVTASEDKTARLWNAENGQPIDKPMEHEKEVVSAQFSPDGQRVITVSEDDTARLWDARTCREIGAPMDFVNHSAQFSPDGKRVVAASWSNTARFWDGVTGEPLGRRMRHQDGVTFAQFSPDGQRVVTVSQDGTAWLWDAASSTTIGEPMRHGAVVTFVQFSPDGQRVVTASRDGTARLWDAASGQAIGEPMQHGGVVTSAQFSPDGQRVVTASWNGTARLWDAITGHAIGEPMQHEGVVASAQFSPDGQRVVTASYDGTARVWEAAIGQTMAEPMEHQKDVVSAQFSPDGQRVVTASMDGTARLWEAATGKPIGEPMKHGDAVRSAQFSPDGQRIVTASDDSTAQLWAVASGQAIGKPMVHKGGRLAEQLIRIVWSAQFSPDGKRVVTASFNGEARLWDAESGQSIGEPMKHGGKVWSAQFSPDGQRVVTACSDNLVTYPPILSNTARVWDAATGQALSEPMKHDGMVHSAQFSPDGQRVVTASFDKTARVWDAATGQALSEPMRHGGKVLSAQFSPDGQRVVTASDDNTARLWDAASGQAIGKPMKHGGAVNSARFSPDGQRVVTASDDNTARLWDAASGQAIGKPMKHGGAVNSARFSPDGQRVVTASSDGTARVWDVPAMNSIDTREDLLLLADLAEATGGVALQTSGQAEMLNVLAPEQVRATREKMAARFAAPSSSLTPLQRCLKWSVSERRSQTISPFSELTIPEWVDNRINEGTPEGLRAAILIEPANARLAAQFGRALADYALKTDTDPAQARRARGEADFLTRRALKLDPDNDEVKRLSIEVAQLLPTAFDSPPGVAPSAPVQLKNEEKSGKKFQRLQPPSKKKPSPRLRSEKTTLSVDQAKAMIAIQHFYCAGWNDSGTGIKHQYEIQVLDDAVVVVDHATGLMWQKGGSGHDNLLIEQAEEYVGKLNAKKWAGFSDWRLPTLEEAMSLMTTQEGGIPDEVMLGDERIKGVMHLNPAFGKDEAPFIWTSDSESSDRGWVVYFWDGKCASEDFDFNAYVRAVRSSTTTDHGEQ